MRWQFIIFFGIFFTVYFSVNFYIFLRGWQALEVYPRFKIWYTVAFWFLAVLYIVSRWLESWVNNGFNDVLVWVGSLWLGMMTYLFFFVLANDIVRSWSTLLNRAPQLWTADYVSLKFYIGLGIFLASAVIVGLGFWNALTPRTKTLEISIPKNGGTKKEWRIAVVSDIHIGTIINKTRFGQLVDSINALEPDAVFLVGDTIDEDIRPVIRGDIGDTLRQLQSPFGVFAIMGNHEYIGGADAAVGYLEEHGVQMLRDRSVLINDGFYLVGREYGGAERFGGGERKSLDELLAGLDLKRPVIMLDHQPSDLKKMGADGRTDLQFSGHTHNGQMWPFNFITKAIFDISWGYGRFGKTQFYVSSGWGTWGPPVRVGNTPELIDLRLKFE